MRKIGNLAGFLIYYINASMIGTNPNQTFVVFINRCNNIFCYPIRSICCFGIDMPFVLLHIIITQSKMFANTIHP